MRRSKLSRLAVLVAAGVAAAPLLPSDASAQWPPPESATDMSNPKYWPNDPGYGWDAMNHGQWNLYSFVPPQDGSSVLRPAEKTIGAGMAVDLAWRHTIGDPEIRIAVTDSGIEWDDADLVEKAWLNPGELMAHKPLHADGTSCGPLTGPLAGFDCNGDGVLSVSDYKDTPSLQPEAETVMGVTYPKGDKNHNGILDPGDLILNYSDGIDDDHNGFIDDISGWDFLHDDNDPYDDTRYGHGTGEARDSSAQANNMMGDAGVCPLCRFVPLRSGDSFITDVTDFGKAVIYATDNGVSVIQCALGTINMNRFAQSALDYAYEKGVLSINSMADENSRHHNMPTVANHTTPVHAIEFDGQNITNSTTFLDYHPCSNFGGHNFLSASGTACSSEATGKTSGIAGLMMSASLKYGINPKLTPGEAQSILFTTAYDIDVPESQMPGSPYKWSQPGFDQRFGYGRVEANAAVEAIRDKKIPPVVDITSPTWYSILYKDQVTSAVPIEGTVSAKRANSFDYVAEWGPGVQPLDSEFKSFAPMQMNIPPTTVIGGASGPIASLDIRSVDPTHTRDTDSKYGENDTAITVRVRAVAHYGGSIGDVRGEMRRTYYVLSDPTLVKGFPMHLGDSGEGSPKMADLDGDGVSELIYPTGGGLVHVFKFGAGGPVELPGFPFKSNVEDGLNSVPSGTCTPDCTLQPHCKSGACVCQEGTCVPVNLASPAYASGAIDATVAREPFMNAPAIADLDGDGKPEIVVSSWSGTIYVLEPDGKLRAGWPKRLPNIPSCPLDPSAPQVTPCMGQHSVLMRGAFASPVLVDMNKDGKLDIVQAAFDGKVYVFNADGTPVDGWPVTIHFTGTPTIPAADPNRILTTPAVADFNGDGYPELLVGSNERLGNGGQSGAMYLIDGRGTKAPKTVLPNWPVTMSSLHLFPLVAEGIPNSGVIGRFQGTLAAVAHGNASLPMILPLDPGAQALLGDTPANGLPASHPDPVQPTQMVVGIDPSSDFGPLTTATQPDTMFPLFAQPSLGDLDQDGIPDVVASGGSLDLAINLEGTGSNVPGDNLLAMWSGKTGAMLPASPMVLEDFTFFNSQAIADLNNDGYPEVITGSGGYFLHAFDGCGREPAGFPKFTGQWIIPTPAVGDVDGDGKLEVAVGTRDGWLYVWHTDGTTSSTIEWESYHHDNQNTGNLETPLKQGGKQLAATPLTAAMCTAATPPAAPLQGSGGCGCALPGEDRDLGGYGVAGGLLALGLAAARRRWRG